MSECWNDYAEEFNDSSLFDNHNIHTGLGLKGIDPNYVVKEASNIMDIGCGEGTNTHLMYLVAKAKTVGIDIATSAINKAKKQYATDRCCFLNCDLKTYLELYDGNPFELITFLGSLDYLKLDNNFFENLNKITKMGSRCFISKFHPMWTALYGNDIDNQIMKSYFDVGRVDLIPYGNKSKVYLKRIHYPISYIYKIFIDNGWELTVLQEPKPSITEASFKYKNYDLDDILMDRMSNVPMTIIFEFERRR